MRRRRNITVTEFVVEVGERSVDWGGVDAFLLWLLREKPEGGFLAHARTISRFSDRSRHPRRPK